MKKFNIYLILPQHKESENTEFIQRIKDESKSLNFNLYTIFSNNDDIDYTLDDDTVIINSDKQYKISLVNNNDTLVWIKFSSLKQKKSALYNLYFILTTNNVAVLNNLNASRIAANKKDTYDLLKKYNIPQPKTIIIKQKDTENHIEFYKKIKEIYGKNSDNNEYILKITNGCCGRGVSLVSEKNIHSVLQCLFSIKEDIEILVQEKIEAKYDIRVFATNINGKISILGAIKRNKIKSDFRSNISLGATAEVIKLNKQQEDLVRQTIKISELNFCGIDIISDNKNDFVLELNSSPGTGGIFRTEGKSFMHTLLNNLIESVTEETTDERQEWLNKVQKMYKWFNNNCLYYDHKHEDSSVYCDLIKKKVKVDCSGFIGACLYYAGYTDDPYNWNVKYGSFNKNKNPNNDDDPKHCNIDKINYLIDNPEWSTTTFNRNKIKAGDIIYSSFHVTIAADDGAEHLYDWGQHEIDSKHHKNNNAVEYYELEYKYRAYWRLNG